jgi:hypothetical protein
MARTTLSLAYAQAQQARHSEPAEANSTGTARDIGQVRADHLTAAFRSGMRLEADVEMVRELAGE